MKSIKSSADTVKYIWMIGLIFSLLLGIAGIAGAWKYADYQTRPASILLPSPDRIVQSKEITAILKTKDLGERVRQYKALIQRVGPVQAQEELYHSGLPFDGDTHLLNHTVGDYLFEHEGNAGLSKCKDYFLSSCYHGFVLNIIATDPNETIHNVAEVMKACSATAAYVVVQCSHGIGHGLLASVGYSNLPKALAQCDQISSQVPSMIALNCYDGVFMENIWAVHHGSPSPNRWVKANDLHYPCDSSYIAEKYLQACWMEQPTIMYQSLKGDIPKVAAECSAIDQNFQAVCFDSLARQIHPLMQSNASVALALCSEFGEKAIDGCLISIVAAAYSTGDRVMPFQLCSQAKAGDQRECYLRLVDIVKTYSSGNERAKMCDKIDVPVYKNLCRA